MHRVRTKARPLSCLASASSRNVVATCKKTIVFPTAQIRQFGKTEEEQKEEKAWGSKPANTSRISFFNNPLVKPFGRVESNYEKASNAEETQQYENKEKEPEVRPRAKAPPSFPTTTTSSTTSSTASSSSSTSTTTSSPASTTTAPPSQAPSGTVSPSPYTLPRAPPISQRTVSSNNQVAQAHQVESIRLQFGASLQKSGDSSTVKNLLLFSALSVAGASALEVVGQTLGMPFVFGPAFIAYVGGVALFQHLKFSRMGGVWVARAMGGVEADATVYPKLHAMVDDICEKAKIVKPKLYVIPTDELNAFASGMNPSNSIVAITDGLLNKLNEEEVKAVLAHEVGHIIHGDVKRDCHITSFVAAFSLMYVASREISHSILRSSSRTSSNNNSSKSSSSGNPLLAAAIAAWLIGLITYFAGLLMRFAVSRQREFAADAASALLTGNPRALQSALAKISTQATVRLGEGNKALFGHMYIYNPSPMSTYFGSVESNYERAKNDSYTPAPQPEKQSETYKSSPTTTTTTNAPAPTQSEPELKVGFLETLLESFSTHPSTYRRIAYLQSLDRAFAEGRFTDSHYPNVDKFAFLFVLLSLASMIVGCFFIAEWLQSDETMKKLETAVSVTRAVGV